MTSFSSISLQVRFAALSAEAGGITGPGAAGSRSGLDGPALGADTSAPAVDIVVNTARP